MRQLLDIINDFGGIAAIGAVVLYVINWSLNKRKARAGAKQSEAEAKSATVNADAAELQTMKESITWVTDSLKDLQMQRQMDAEEREKNEKKINGMGKCVTAIYAAVQPLDLHYCAKTECTSREPRFGEHHTKLPELKDFYEEKDRHDHFNDDFAPIDFEHSKNERI